MTTTAADIEALRSAAAERGREHDRAVLRVEQATEALAALDRRLHDDHGLESPEAAQAEIDRLTDEIDREAARVRGILAGATKETTTT